MPCVPGGGWQPALDHAIACNNSGSRRHSESRRHSGSCRRRSRQIGAGPRTASHGDASTGAGTAGSSRPVIVTSCCLSSSASTRDSPSGAHLAAVPRCRTSQQDLGRFGHSRFGHTVGGCRATGRPSLDGQLRFQVWLTPSTKSGLLAIEFNLMCCTGSNTKPWRMTHRPPHSWAGFPRGSSGHSFRRSVQSLPPVQLPKGEVLRLGGQARRRCGRPRAC